MTGFTLSEKVIVVMRETKRTYVLDKVISYQPRVFDGALLATFEPGELWLVSTAN